MLVPRLQSRFRALMSLGNGRAHSHAPPIPELPIRAELFSVEQLERHARTIAATQQLHTGRSADKLLHRLSDNNRILNEAYALITAAVERKRRVSPAAEWLLDNFYFIEEQIRSTRRLLPRSYSGELPSLRTGPNAEYPRAYGIALELVAHTDGRVDAVSLNGFVSAFQSVVPLKLGELWALPLMLRLALLENLRRVAVRICAGRRDRDIATEWAIKMVDAVEESPSNLVLILADMARTNPPLTGPFLAEFTRHLQAQNANFAIATAWLEQRLSDQGQSIEQLVQANSQEQASDQVSVGNSITSLRFLSSHDWRTFVAEQSLVENTLRGDPAGAYANMDFATRDRYRHAVEAIARRSNCSEYEVADRAIQLARAEAAIGLHPREAHVGYFLIDRGRPALERLVHMRFTISVVVEKIRRKIPLTIYLCCIGLVTGLTGAWLWRAGLAEQRLSILLGLIIPVILCAAHLGIGLANLLTAIVMRPQAIPRMDFRNGIPPQHRTLVAVPTMLSNAASVESLLERIEVRYLANRDPSLSYALLTDFEDAASQHLPADADLLMQVTEGVKQLNLKYCPDREGIFYLLHRDRKWNQQENVWMGYERKRGKLADLNATLRGARDRFSRCVGDIDLLSGVKYVITLDTDTQLPRDAARELVGAMAHPLNRPVVSVTNGRVTDGYTILQPRVGVNLPSSRRSWYVRLFGGDSGIDPYTRVVSDLYQDLFAEGSFIGKGIYDVDFFERYCGDFPVNRILSHDLIESCYGRSALLTDVVLYEDFPASYAADAARRHRWMRGDWQIAAWILPRVPSASSKRIVNPISALSRWKIFDNLRRSLVPAALLAMLLIAWLLAPRAFAMTATIFAILVISLPPLLSAIMVFVRKPVDLPLNVHLAFAFSALGKPLAQCFATLVFLPHDTFISLDAVIRTAIRVHWTKVKLLEWKTSSHADRSTCNDLRGFFRNMAIAPVIAIVALLALAIWRFDVLPIAMPFLGLWIFAPAIAWYLSRDIVVQPKPLTKEQDIFLRRTARKTWHYFETFVTADDNWLPPDNVQLNPALMIASRTSPTNIGLALLSDLAAYDFGYCSVGRLLDRTAKTFSTLERMERYRGHFYNWYDTQSLVPLTPRYVSTVDSGNLVGHLFVFAQGLQQLMDAPLLPARVFRGLGDSLRVVKEETRNRTLATDQPRMHANWERDLERYIGEFESLPNSLNAVFDVLPKLAIFIANSRSELGTQQSGLGWIGVVENNCAEYLNELEQFASWKLQKLPAETLWPTVPPTLLARWRQLQSQLTALDGSVTLRQVASLSTSLCPLIESLADDLKQCEPQPSAAPNQIIACLEQLRDALLQSSNNAAARIRAVELLVTQCYDFANMDFEFLQSKTQDLFAIGYNTQENRLDGSCYDLLASEARLASFVLIAQGHLGQESWFALGRLLTNTTGTPALLSWSGSMFEYLMPLLVMPTHEHTLLDQTYRSIVRRQIAYGRQRGVPWGISESGYNTVDLNNNYQYRAFGVPGLGLKRGLAEDLVVAPYACALGLMIEPDASCRNLQRLEAEHRSGDYGFFEAVDYTPSRLPPNVDSVTVRQYMGHHAGMSLLSLAYVLLDKPMQGRFLADPTFRAAEMLLHEQVPKNSVPVYPHAIEAEVRQSQSAAEAGMMRVFSDPNSPVPEVHLLSNGRYHIMVTSAGGGYSRWRDLAVTRWREDSTRDCYGTFCYLRDLDSGVVWSTALHPSGQSTNSYEAIFTQARAEFRHRHQFIEMHSQISVSSEDDMELRRVTLTNRSDRVRTIEFTSYAEVVLATQAQDESHPAFSNLFVQSEIDRKYHAILCTRRPRSAEEHPPWLMHMMSVVGTSHCKPSFETDRMKFIGRGRSLAAPAIFDNQAPLSNTAGATLDPIVSVRQTLRIEPNESVRVDIVLGVAETRASVLAMAEKYSDPHLADRVFELAWTRGPIELQQLNASESDAQAFGRLAGSIIYSTSLRRAKVNVLARNQRSQSSLWGYGISGDLPIMLVRIRNFERIDLLRQAIQAHAFWRMKGLSVDLVIWNEDDSIYRQSLQDSILDVVAMSSEATLVDRPGGIFYRRGEQMSEEDRLLLQTVARVVLSDDAGSLSEQVERRARLDASMPVLPHSKRRIDYKTEAPTGALATPVDLEFFNGLGGFSHDGREYITVIEPQAATPAPWINVIANEQLGFVVSESGSGYTWAENSHEYRLTPWMNDPVTDSCGEAFYVRDEETCQFWSPSPLPARGVNTYVARHGFGYTIFDYTEDGITTELCFYVAIDAPVKFARVKVTNHSGRARKLSLTGYWEWVLGDVRSKTAMHVVTDTDPATGAILARNAYSSDFGDRVAFADCSESQRTFTGDRREFLGRNGSLANPAAMRRTRLSNRTGAGFDPCTAIQTQFSLADGNEKVIVFTCGSAIGEQVQKLILRARGERAAQQSLEGVWHYWSQTLGRLYVETPDNKVNFLTNGWLIYQTLACRMWARTGFYQSGGAFGFRDQLQDAMALIHSEPGLLRSHILRAASRQFREGDVQHWWHPPVGRGVRTHFSDDFLWLPRAICRYVQATGDTGLLDERTPFLTARALHDDEEANYDLPQTSGEIASMYDHAIRAIDHALRFGSHGLPLMGCGDWNDGMNLVGQHGKGESVWLAFFLYDTLNQFAELATERNDIPTADRYSVEAGRLRGNIEQTGWDGQWYRRAYFDDGTPLGSAENEECQIDSISQCWAVLSGAGPRERTLIAMESVNRRLVRRNDRLIQLLDPPFDKSALNPGYIKGYVPGVRENGGQYTHAAIWTAMAFAELGDSERAWELFELMNPITHGATPESIATYRVEPYVVAADVYGVAPHIGRGGWTWYTGSAGWMYRLVTESLLGLHLESNTLRFAPRAPQSWPTYKIHYRFYQSQYHITFINGGQGSSVKSLSIDGVQQTEHKVPLINDGKDHDVTIELA